MITIRKATVSDYDLIAELGATTFIQAYQEKVSRDDLNTFVSNTFNKDLLIEELSNSNIHYYLQYFNNKIAGYTKIVLNVPNANISAKNITKLDRLYLLKKYYGQQLGASLFTHICNVTKKLAQQGIWLYVWDENQRAVDFYSKNNFKIVGHHDFKVSETRSNPNHIMYLEH